ncbi:PucR family transcriptional regulator [Gordonia sp. CPCC 205333]|uniref:PucR family transcriptional regulator n=1 Tax=Gordonia sp. CPCC 205333 TaxID=3140790 RepID=UPI003AF3C406
MTSARVGDEGDAARRRLARVPAMADQEVLACAATVARQLRTDYPEVVSDVTTTLAREIDYLDADPIIHELLDASVQGNISTIIHVLANDIPVDHLQPTTAAVEYALRLAQRDVPSNSLVRAYHMGQSVVMRRCYRLVDELMLPAPAAMAVTLHISDVIFSYIDWITLYVFQAYEDERRRWLGAEGNVLSSTVHQLLSAADADTALFERETGYPVDQFHLAVIAWSADEASDLTDLDRSVRTLAAKLNSDGPPIVTAIDRRTVWGWIPLGARNRVVDTSAVAGLMSTDARTRIALGLPADGTRGFRRSHAQAQAAFSVATAPNSPTGAVIGFGDRGIAVVSLLARDLDSTRAWVREVLGDLADDTPTAGDLRQTLSVFFANRDSHLRTAEQLNLHRNTVKYRVDKAMGETSANGDRLDLALALAVCEFLGSTVIGSDRN